MPKYPLRFDNAVEFVSKVKKLSRSEQAVNAYKFARASRMQKEEGLARAIAKSGLGTKVAGLARGLGEASNKSLILDLVNPQRVSDAARDFGQRGPKRRKA